MSIRALTAGALVVSALLLQGCSSTVSPVDTWGDDGPGRPQLTLSGDGRVSGTDGCNRLMGFWEEIDGTIELSEFASTLMACEGVDTWLSGARSLEINGDTMHVFDGGGQELGTLGRS